MKFVDVTGYGNSGKTAVSDYLKDFENIASFPNHVEFELFRAKNGIVDLYFSNYENWGLIRSNYSILEFHKLVNRIGNDSNRFPFFLNNFFASGHNYNRLFNDQFIKISDEYLSSLSGFSYNSFWPYQYLYHNSIKMFYLKILRKLNLYDDSTKIILTSKNDFKNLTNIYLNKLFGTVTNASHEFFLLNNSFDFNPEPCLNLIENGYSIIVERDPRDIFASTLNSQDGFIPIVERTLENNILKKRKFLGTSEISQFIKRYKILRLNENKSNNSRILRLRFEDFVINHLETADQLNNFLKLDLRNKKVSELLFNPEESKQNVGIWKKYRHLPEIAIIEKELGEYCYQN